MSDETGRRDFFKEALNQIIKPVADFIDDRIGDDVFKSEPIGEILRPPGALSETEFLETCHRCSNCVNNCPADAIQPIQSRDANLANTPYIDPDYQPCVICDSLACMYVCPSSALQTVFAEDIRMGIAIFHAETCLRANAVDCTYCVDSCPIGENAIKLANDGLIEIHDTGCTGCGVCQYACPTSPKSIVITSLTYPS